jgi:hypothetical protein
MHDLSDGLRYGETNYNHRTFGNRNQQALVNLTAQNFLKTP